MITGSDLDTLITRLEKNFQGHSRSLDSLLTQITLEAKREELLESTEELDEYDTLPVSEKAMKSLHLSDSYIDEVKRKKNTETENAG